MSFLDSLGTAIGAYLKPAILAEIKVVGDALIAEVQKLAPQLETAIENEAVKVGKDVEDRLPEIADGVAKTIVTALMGPINNLIDKIPHFPGF